ncbi:MAG: hypothetical protein HYV62_15480 [Candidatus Rokubacteria bacterium]|nr:hypothetical protein [Candidatus Rokubacteria bacterium]
MTMVTLVRESIPPSECGAAGLELDTAIVTPGVSLPLFAVLDKINAVYMTRLAAAGGAG